MSNGIPLIRLEPTAMDLEFAKYLEHATEAAHANLVGSMLRSMIPADLLDGVTTPRTKHVCPDCGRTIAVKGDGSFYRHRMFTPTRVLRGPDTGRYQPWCEPEPLTPPASASVSDSAPAG